MSWVSKYGAVTFNLIGKEFPCGGMNEAGLVVRMVGVPPHLILYLETVQTDIDSILTICIMNDRA